MPQQEIDIIFKLTRWKMFLIYFWTFLKREDKADKVIESCMVIEKYG